MPNTRLNMNDKIPASVVRKADILLEALPYLRAFRGKTFVIKYGGSALADVKKRRSILEDIVFLSIAGIRPVLVHGGGAEISRRMSGKGRSPRFIQGLRVTDRSTLQLVIRSLTEVNRMLTRELKSLGARAQGLMGSEGRLIHAEPYTIQGEDLGFVGTVTSVNTGPIQRLLVLGVIPVVVPLGAGWNHQVYNINADEAAAALAAALKAEKFVLVTDVPGILLRPKDHASLVSTVTVQSAGSWIHKGIISGGMIPKTKACMRALAGGVRKTHMIDITIPHGLLLEIFTDRGIGTEIVAR